MKFSRLELELQQRVGFDFVYFYFVIKIHPNIEKTFFDR